MPPRLTVSLRCVAAIGLTLVLLAACERAARLVDTWRGRRPLDSFRRDRFETFESDEALARFLDAASFVAEHSRGSSAPTPPRDMPSRAQPPGSSVSIQGWHPMAGGFSWASRRERAERIAVRDGFVFVLYGNKLQSYALDPSSKRLDPRAVLKLRAALHAPRIEHRPGGYDAEGGVTNSPELVSDTRVYGRLFAAEGELIVLASLQHRSAIELVRICVGENGELEQREATWIHVRALGTGGYRARMIGQRLVIYVAHDPVYAHVYSLPGIGPDEDAAQPRVLLHAKQVYRPVVNTFDLRLHTLINCDLTVRPLSCDAQGLFGPASEPLMGSDAAYLLLAEVDFFAKRTAPSVVARLPYDGSPATGALVEGVLRSSSDEALYQTQGKLYALLEQGRSKDQIELLNLPLSQFSAAPAHAPDATYHPIARVAASDSVTFNAYLGDYVIADEPSAADSESGSTPFATRFVRLTDATSTVLRLGYLPSHAIDLGGDALLMGHDTNSLHFSIVHLKGPAPTVVTGHVMPDVMQENFDTYGAPRVLAADSDTSWVQVELKPKSPLPRPPTTLLPLRYRSATASLDAQPTWTFESADAGYNIDVAGLGSDVIVLRAENQLLVQHLTQAPTTLQRIVLDR